MNACDFIKIGSLHDAYCTISPDDGASISFNLIMLSLC